MKIKKTKNKVKVEKTLYHYRKGKSEIIEEEFEMIIGLGDLIESYVELKTLPWWKKTDLKRKYQIKEIKNILNDTKVITPECLTDFISELK